MTLETIVPELETCRRIPQGAFKDSALVWSFIGKTYTEEGVFFITDVITREDGKHTNIQCPAPTLEEILDELPDGTYVKKHESSPVYEVFSLGHEVGYSDNNPAEAALRLWERVNGGKG